MRRRRWALGLVLAAALAAGAYAVAVQQRSADAAAQRERGAALFDGRAPLAGRLVGHETALPALATRCANCHDEASATPASEAAASAAAKPFATALTGAQLAQARPRRGGPPSAYDAARLCAVLRSGTDPAHVMISTTMPRYDVTDLQCRDLWAFLGAR